MDVKNKRINGWLPWLIAVVFLCLFVVLWLCEWAQQEQQWQQQLSSQQATQRQTLWLNQRYTTQQAMLLAQLIAQNQAVVNLLRKAYQAHLSEGGNGGAASSALLREQLSILIQPYWERMAPVGVHEINVYFSPLATVFYRAHKHEMYGDNAPPSNSLVLDVLAQGNSQGALSVGSFGSIFRAMVPVFSDSEADSHTVIAGIEVGLAVLQSDLHQEGQDQAVLLNPTLVDHVLWNEAQSNARENTGELNDVSNGQWGLESYTDAQVKTWFAQKRFSNPIASHETPWMLSDQGKEYLLFLNPLDTAVEQSSVSATDSLTVSTSFASSPVLILTWSDISQAFAGYKAMRMQTALKYLLELLVAELAVWCLFYYDNKHAMQLMREHGEQLQCERDTSEYARRRLNLALVSSESGFWEWNITTNRAILSKEWRALCGLPANDGGDADIEEWLTRIHPSDKKNCHSEMLRHIKGETAMLEAEYRLRIADGSYIWIFTRGKVVEWEPDGRALLIVGVYTDITKRKQHELLRLRQQAALSALNEIAAVASNVGIDEQLYRGLSIGARLLGLDVGTVSRIQGNQYYIRAQTPLNNTSPNTVADALSNYYCEETYKRKGVFTLDNVQSSDLFSHYAHKKYSIVSYIGIPIWLHGRIYGTLSFTATHARAEPFDTLDQDFIHLLARWVSGTLEYWQHQSEQQILLDRFAKLSANLPGFLYQFQMFTDGSSSFPYASDGIEAIYGLKQNELVQNAATVLNVLHPDDVGWIGESLSTSAAQLSPWLATYRVLHPTLGEIWVHGEAKPERLADGSTLWHGFVRDVTIEKNAELKLQEINTLREAIFDAASISIISTDQHGIIKTFNHCAEDLLGYSAAEMININTPGILHLPEEIVARAEKLSREFSQSIEPGFEVFIAKAREGDVDENEWTYVRKNGSHVPVVLSVTALRNIDGDISGYLGLGRDISEIKRIDQMKTEFISTVSHELRTPLTSISGALGIIMSGAAGAMPETAIKMLNIAHKNSLRLIHLVNDLLDMEKLVAGKMHFDLKTQLLLPVVQQAIEANTAYAAQFNVTYQLNSQWVEDVRVTVDALRLQQVITNLLSNAAKFSPSNDVVVIDIEKNFNIVRVSVSDRGIGISEEFRGRIFQKFSQVDSSDTRQKGGTGLGLAVSKEIIERMSGRIDFNSVAGQGTQFYFELACEDIHVRIDKVKSNRAAGGKRILVVEDSPEIAELLALILRNNNYRVDIAYTGKMAQERLALHAYQLLTVDLNLPDMNGRELIRQLRSDSSTQHVPVIVLTSDLDYGRENDKNDTKLSNVEWLEKPLEADNLISIINRALQENKKVIS